MKKVFQEQRLLLSFKGKQKSHSNSCTLFCKKQNKKLKSPTNQTKLVSYNSLFLKELKCTFVHVWRKGGRCVWQAVNSRSEKKTWDNLIEELGERTAEEQRAGTWRTRASEEGINYERAFWAQYEKSASSFFWQFGSISYPSHTLQKRK